VNKQDIIVAGVGGQGILTVAGVICHAAVDMGLRVKQSEVHGMAQRGGAVISHLRLSENPIASDLVPHGSAHLVLAMEPMEGLRHLPHAHPEAMLIANCTPVKNVAVYPEMEGILRRIRERPAHIILDAEKLAREAGNVKAVNSVMLGAASDRLIIPWQKLRDKVAEFFARKGEKVVEQNLKAFDLGRAAAKG
jgi:indolepyruvate ferredoxin oxidoreductase beta subunit